MAFVDLARGKLILKVVLAGPPAVGKTERLCQLGPVSTFGSRVTGETSMVALPIEAQKEGRQVELEIYEWHGPERADVRAKALFVGLDGIIYITDAREDRWVDSTRQFEFLVEKVGKSKVQRLPALLLLGRMDEGLLRLASFEHKLQGPTWSERLELPIDEVERFLEAVRVYGEVMLARVL